MTNVRPAMTDVRHSVAGLCHPSAHVWERVTDVWRRLAGVSLTLAVLPPMPTSEALAPAAAPEAVDLSRYDNAWFSPGRGLLVRTLWHYANVLLLQNPFNLSSRLRVAVLRAFGARVGQGVNIKPGVNVKYPWHVEIGDHVWIGEGAWLDSLAPIAIGPHACISQGAYLCTGNHDWSDPAFGLRVGPITIERGAWIGARAVVLSGVTVGAHAVVSAGAVLSRNAEPNGIYTGNPAQWVKARVIRERSGA